MAAKKVATLLDTVISGDYRGEFWYCPVPRWYGIQIYRISDGAHLTAIAGTHLRDEAIARAAFLDEMQWYADNGHTLP